jgi:D-alanyl-D-alanine carboxypeptidase
MGYSKRAEHKISHWVGTKQFMAAAVLQLVERGTLKLADPISQYYPDAPASWQMITIRHLLTHMSGIPSYTGLSGFPAKISSIDLSPQEIIKLTRDQPLEFEPGTAYAYDNTGYILLGHVIEKVSGLSYARYLQDNIFSALGMNDTGYDLNAVILSRRASGYSYSDRCWNNLLTSP